MIRASLRVLRSTARDALDNDLAGEAAKMAYYFFLSLFPLLVVLFAVTGLVGGDAVYARILATAERVVPDYAWQFVRQLVREITERGRPGLLSAGVLLTLWAASNGVAALTVGLNRIYEVKEPRPWWKRRLLALAVLAGTVVLLVAGTASVIPSEEALRGTGLSDAWSLARWPIGFALVTGAVWLAYRYLPARDQRGAHRETLIGAVCATLLWMLVAVLFREYLARFSSYGATYGALGAVIVLMLWFYLGALVVLLGAELAATLETDGARVPVRGARAPKG